MLERGIDERTEKVASYAGIEPSLAGSNGRLRGRDSNIKRGRNVFSRAFAASRDDLFWAIVAIGADYLVHPKTIQTIQDRSQRAYSFAADWYHRRRRI